MLKSRLRTELIDTLWNVNLIPPDLFRRGKEELIDTLWNVNDKSDFYMVCAYNELIDTLWNVNEYYKICSLLGKWN